MTFGMNVMAQVDYKRKIFKTKVERGDGLQKEIVLEFLSTKRIILLSEQYQDYKIQRANLVEDLYEDDVIDAFLNFSIDMVIATAKSQLPHPETLDFPIGEIGVVAISNENGKLLCKIPFTADRTPGYTKSGFIYTMDEETYVVFN